jgi:hypothetical protein
MPMIGFLSSLSQAQTARFRLTAIYPFREFAEAGGLLSYGTNIANAHREAGIYAGRILRGTKPQDVPVVQPTTFEFILNIKAREGARPHRATDAARPCQRRDRMSEAPGTNRLQTTLSRPTERQSISNSSSRTGGRA